VDCEINPNEYAILTGIAFNMLYSISGLFMVSNFPSLIFDTGKDR
jgi:hypothetical protein